MQSLFCQHFFSLCFCHHKQNRWHLKLSLTLSRIWINSVLSLNYWSTNLSSQKQKSKIVYYMEPHGYIVDINMFLHRIGREHVTAYLGLPLVQISLSTNLNINKLSTYLKLWYRSMQLDFFFLNACSISNG